MAEDFPQGSMFEPKNGIAERDMIYTRIRTMSINEVITYPELDAVLGRDFRSDRTPLQRALADLLQVERRTMVCVEGVGYRVAHPREHVGIAARKVRRARRMVKRSVDITVNTDRKHLNAEEIKTLDAVSMINQGLLNSIRREERKMFKATRAAATTTREQNDAAIIADAQRRLERSQQRS